MLFGGLEALAYNSNRKMSNIKLFEFGKTYHNYPDGREEKKHLSLVISGNTTEDNWYNGSQKSDFFYGKGIVTSILERLGINDLTERSVKNDIFSEGISLVKNKMPLVEFGVVRKKVLKAFDIDSETLYIDFVWDNVLSEISSEDIKMRPIPKFPKVKRDFALLIDENVGFDALKNAAFQTEKQLLKEVSLFDVYTGSKLPKGKKSYALSFTIQDERKTLTDKQIDKIMSKLEQRFAKDFGASLR